jgi:5-methylcytosine-specific restriction endonuclease McrA
MRSRSKKMQRRYEGGVCTYCRGRGISFVSVPVDAEPTIPTIPTKAIRAPRFRSEARSCTSCGGTGESVGRRSIVASVLREHPRCQARDVADPSLTLGRLIARQCRGTSTEVHERLPRSAGGSITDRSNCIALCRACHELVTQLPEDAIKLGLLDSRYDGRNAAARGLA